MPTLGYLLGSTFEQYITSVDHWVAFILLSVIGGNMLKEAFSKDEETADASFAPKAMLLMAVATSIDALAVGITLALLPGVNIAAAVLFIGCITFILSAVGLKVGNVFGLKYKNKAEMVGGAILILMGLKFCWSIWASSSSELRKRRKRPCPKPDRSLFTKISVQYFSFTAA